MDRLPDEILLMIFKHIKPHYLGTSVAKVCRRWNRLIALDVLRILHPGDEKKIHRGLTALLVTSFVPGLQYSTNIISQAASMLPNLKELTICMEYSLDHHDLSVLGRLHNLRHLDVFVRSDVLDINTRIPSGVTSLVVNNNMFPGFLGALKKHQRRFNAFHMYGKCYFFRPVDMAEFLNQHSVHLTELTLRCAEATTKLYQIIGKCTNLVSLQLYVCSELTPHGAAYLTGLNQLRRLHITEMKMVRIRSLYEFIQHLPRRIEDLNLSYSWFGEEHCGVLVARLPKLRFLEIWQCRISATSLLHLTKFLTSLEKLNTDVQFDLAHIHALTNHSSLKNLCCKFNGQINTRFRMKSVTATIPVTFLRDYDHVGPQAEIFYYWA